MRTSIHLAAFFLAAGCVPDEAAPPNVVLIVSDDHDYEHLGFLGNPFAPTPTIDGLAEAGAVFPVAHVPAARCRPSYAALLSGRWPHQTGIYASFGPGHLPTEGTLPELFEQAGYATYMGGKFWEGDPAEKGFTANSGYVPSTNRGTLVSRSFARENQADLLAFVEEHAGEKPLFVWWAPLLPHVPHDPPERFLERFDPAAIPIPDGFTGDPEEYRRLEHLSYAMEAWLDESVAELLEAFHSAGAYEDTLFVFLIDNGWANGFPSKGTGFEKGVRTPLVFTYPAGIPEPVRIDSPASSVDVYATVLDYAGIEPPPGTEGRSLRPVIEGAEGAVRDALYGVVFPQTASPASKKGTRPEEDVIAIYARTPRWKYVLYLQDVREADDERLRIQSILSDYPERRRGDEDLFDLEADPHETRDLAGDEAHSDRMAELRAAALAWWSSSGGGELDLP